jgi:hypothetical protein
MRDQRSSAPPARRRDDEIQLMVLALLLDQKAPALWSVDELARDLGCELHVPDAIAQLHAAGLAHLCGGFVFATRAASRFGQLLRE